MNEDTTATPPAELPDLEIGAEASDNVRKAISRAKAALDDDNLPAAKLAITEAEQLRGELAHTDPLPDDLWHTMPVDWAGKRAVDPPPRSWLLRARKPDGSEPGFMPAHRVGLLAAAGGTGKSWALCQLAVSIATGLPWLGTWWPAEPGRVLLVLAEEERDEAQRRMHGAYRVAMHDAGGWGGQRIEPGQWHQRIVVLPLAGQSVRLLDDEKGADTDFMRRLLERLDDGDPWSAVILDPLSRFAPADAEIDNAAATRTIQALERMSHVGGRGSGPAVIVAHHSSKAVASSGTTGQDAARGASGLVDGARWMGAMNRERDKNKRTISDFVRFDAPKSNYAADSRGVTLIHDRKFDGALRRASAEDKERLEQLRSGDDKKKPAGKDSNGAKPQPVGTGKGL